MSEKWLILFIYIIFAFFIFIAIYGFDKLIDNILKIAKNSKFVEVINCIITWSIFVLFFIGLFWVLVYNSEADKAELIISFFIVIIPIISLLK